MKNGSTRLLAAHANDPGGARPVGWYHSHTRSEIFLSDADLKIHQTYFPESWQVALVMKPHTLQPARIGFFFRETDGSVHSTASYREETLDALPVRQMPNGAPPAPAAPAPNRTRAASASTLLPSPSPPPKSLSFPNRIRPPRSSKRLPAVPAPEPEAPELVAPEPPPPAFLIEHPAAGRNWMVAGIGFVAVLGICGAAFRMRQLWLPRTMVTVQSMVAATQPAPAAAPAPVVVAPPPTLKLSTLDREGQLQISWDRNSPVLQHAGDAVLEINEGKSALTAIQLDAAHLQAGSFTYARTAEKVDVKLTVHQEKGPDLREVTSFLGKLPERQPVETPAARKQREDAAKQAAKLKADLTLQAAKTKKLERDLKSARAQMRLQQIRRMKNQAPDK